MYKRQGYDWAGAQTEFATTATPNDVLRSGGAPYENSQGITPITDTPNNSYQTAANWGRKYDVLNLGILPLFHA